MTRLIRGVSSVVVLLVVTAAVLAASAPSRAALHKPTYAAGDHWVYVIDDGHPTVRSGGQPERDGESDQPCGAELDVQRLRPDDEFAKRDEPLLHVASRRPLPRERHG